MATKNVCYTTTILKDPVYWGAILYYPSYVLVPLCPTWGPIIEYGEGLQNGMGVGSIKVLPLQKQEGGGGVAMLKGGGEGGVHNKF